MKKNISVSTLNGASVKADKLFVDLCQGIVHGRGKGNMDVNEDVLNLFISIYN